MRALALAIVLLVALARPSLAVDVSQLSDVENDPCVASLLDRNSDQHVDRANHPHVDVPDSVFADACERMGGNADRAWDHVLATWSPRAVPVAASGGLTAMASSWIIVLGLLLLGPVLLGYPVRGLVLQRMGQTGLAEAAVELALRAGLALVLLPVLALPFLRILGGLALAGFVVLAFRRLTGARPAGAEHRSMINGIVDDVVGSLGSILAVALAARGDWRIVLLGVVITAALALRPAARLRFRLRSAARSRVAVAAVLVLLAGACAVGDPALHLFAG